MPRELYYGSITYLDAQNRQKIWHFLLLASSADEAAGRAIREGRDSNAGCPIQLICCYAAAPWMVEEAARDRGMCYPKPPRRKRTK